MGVTVKLRKDRPQREVWHLHQDAGLTVEISRLDHIPGMTLKMTAKDRLYLIDTKRFIQQIDKDLFCFWMYATAPLVLLPYLIFLPYLVSFWNVVKLSICVMATVYILWRLSYWIAALLPRHIASTYASKLKTGIMRSYEELLDQSETDSKGWTQLIAIGLAIGVIACWVIATIGIGWLAVLN